MIYVNIHAHQIEVFMREFQEQNLDLGKATLTRRFAAMFYDSLLCIALLMVTTGVYMTVATTLIGKEAYKQLNDSGATIGDPILSVVLLATLVLFFGYFWTRTGQTLGMQVWHLRVQDTDQKRITWPQAVIRIIGALLSACAFGAGYFWMLVDKKDRSFQCILSKTEVVRVPARPKS